MRFMVPGNARRYPIAVEGPAQLGCRRRRSKIATPQPISPNHTLGFETIFASCHAALGFGEGAAAAESSGSEACSLDVLGFPDNLALALDSSARVSSSSARTLASSSSSWRIMLPPAAPRARARAFSATCAAVRAGCTTLLPLGCFL